ncbi:hypothetical protein NS230_13590 [Methylobacterium indicum]|uniref:hypothetical protein n=1 Tax=Methylobacterium indicum TaxID=1775910 RepID=UPI000734A60F|nr:hypothetical protein [Methylobacterium indicum]KTS51713.1 hypothetical protein NS230_13590 [Methylobacterium indicum]
MAPQGNLLARAEAVVERAFRIAAEHETALARARSAVQPLREAAARQEGGVSGGISGGVSGGVSPALPQDADRQRAGRPA